MAAKRPKSSPPSIKARPGKAGGRTSAGRLREKLKDTKGRLQRSEEQLQNVTAVHEERSHATSQQVQDTEEKLRSSYEDLAKAKEELQCSNEELEAVNAELKESLEALKESEQHFRLLVQDVQDYAIFMLDPQGRVATWNEGGLRIKGYRAEEIIGQHFSRFYPSEKLKTGWPAHELEYALRNGRFEDEGWRLRKDGSRFWANVVITPIYDAHGKHRGFSKVTRDLTERRRMEETIRQSDERFRLMVEGVKDYAIFMLDPEGHVATWNAGAEQLKGYRADQIIGQHFSQFYPPEAIKAGWPAHELECATRDGRFEDEGWRVRKDGSQFWANVVITALHDSNGQLRGFSKITRDLTERKKAMEQLRGLAAQMENMREEESTRIAHEIHDELGQAMTGLKLDIELAKRQYTGIDSSLGERLEAMLAQVRAMLVTVRNIATQLRPVVLDQLGLLPAIQWLVDELRPRTDIEFKLNFQMRDMQLPGDRKTVMFRIVQEILTNVVRHANARHVTITAQERAGRAVMEVVDDGRGITWAELTDPKSFGLIGMRHRASLVGGEVVIKPLDGGGTAATVVIPLDGPEANA